MTTSAMQTGSGRACLLFRVSSFGTVCLTLQGTLGWRIERNLSQTLKIPVKSSQSSGEEDTSIFHSKECVYQAQLGHLDARPWTRG